MAYDVRFKTWAFDENSHIILNVIREKSPSERTLFMSKPAGGIGVDILGKVPRAKIIELEGTISVRGSDATYTSTIRDFVAAMLEQGDLHVGTVDGTFVYEDCICVNPENILRNEHHYNIDFIPFRVELLAPKGRALANNLTRATYTITESPYTNDINLLGTANPDPYLTFTIDSVGTGLSKISFLHRQTNDLISVSTAFSEGDVIIIDTKDKQVTWNTKSKGFDGVFPHFTTGTNRFQVDLQGSVNDVAIQQTDYDSDYSVYGTNYLSQKINPDSTMSVYQINLQIKELITESELLQEYDSFKGYDNIDATKWNTTGNIDEASDSRLVTAWAIRSGTAYTSEMDTNDKTAVTPPGEPITGLRAYMYRHDPAGGSSPQFADDPYGELTDGTNYIRISWPRNLDSEYAKLTTSGTYGSHTQLITPAGSVSNVYEFRQEGSDILIYHGKNLVHTIGGKTIAANSYFKIHSKGDPAHTGTDSGVRLTSLLFYNASQGTANEDIQVRIETDSAGEPSGTPVTNGTTTIKASDVSTEQFTELSAVFATPPSITSGTDYHIVVQQAGGDKDNYWQVRANTPGGYSQGNILTSTDSGTTWTTTTDDAWFKVFGGIASNFQVTMNLDYFITHHSVV